MPETLPWRPHKHIKKGNEWMNKHERERAGTEGARKGGLGRC